MKKYLLTGLLITIFLILIITYYYIKNSIPGYSPEVATEMIRANKFDYIVDVRTQEEWNQGHNSKALFVPIDKLVTDLPVKIKDKNSRILFVCRKGIRSSAAAAMAARIGYKNVTYVDGIHNGLSNA